MELFWTRVSNSFHLRFLGFLIYLGCFEYVDVDFGLPPCFLGNGSERATGGILEEFLARHGKALDAAMEEKRLGKMHKESAAAIVQDYGLPMTPEEFSEAIMPLFQER